MVEEHRDGIMNKAYYLLLPVLFGLGFWGFSNRVTLLKMAEPLTNTLGSIWDVGQNTWNGLPTWVKGLIPLGIPIATTVFFAWASSLWRKKAQQTEILAAKQQTQMQGELTEAQQVNTNLTGTIQTLSSQPSNTSTLELREALLSNEQKDIRVRALEDNIHALQSEIKELKLKIYALEIRLKEVTTIA